MFKSPERVFHISMWMVSIVFASFLLGLGAKIIEDIPAATKTLKIEEFSNVAKLDELKEKQTLLRIELDALENEFESTRQKGVGVNNDYLIAQSAHKNWLGTRNATSNNPNVFANDPELEKRTRELDVLANASREAQNKTLGLQLKKDDVANQWNTLESTKTALLQGAMPKYQNEVRNRELRIFGLRLLITLPLVLVGVWLFKSKRKSQYWPLARGYIIFSGWAFFIELVPYLPSYGGYVRYIVGIVLSIVGGHYGIKSMQLYLVRRKAEALKDEQERRLQLNQEVALTKMDSGLCPACDRKIPKEIDGQKVNHCVHCGLSLFLICKTTACGARNNAFYHYCPTCGEDKATEASI